MPTVYLYGPQGSGKSTIAPYLAEVLGLTAIVDDEFDSGKIPENALVLTNLTRRELLDLAARKTISGSIMSVARARELLSRGGTHLQQRIDPHPAFHGALWLPDENVAPGVTAEEDEEWARRDVAYKKEKKDATYFLYKAGAEMADRARVRDAVERGERSVARAVDAFWTIYGPGILSRGYMTETDGWEFMSMLKKVRGAQGAYREDDFVDDVAYAALAAESAARAAQEDE